jgi:hypothetical protein
MCMGCWEEEDRPWKATDTAREWAPKFAEANHYGPLHIVVDDWNLEDCHLEFCRGQSPNAEEVALLDALAAMSYEERWTTAIWSEDDTFRPESRNN